MGRTTEAYSGSEARDFNNGTNSGTPTGPYRQSYQYNALNQITQQTNRLWSQTQTTSNSFVNNRLQDWSYDADGGLTNDGNVSYTRDAAGRYVQRGMGGTYYGSKFDGDGRLVGTSLTSANGTLPTYYLNSSVMGLAVAKLDGNGQKVESYVYAGRRKLATATPWQLVRSHVDPVTGSHGHSASSGGYGADAEFNADGVEVGFAEPTQEEPEFSGFKYPEVAGGAGCYVGNPNCVTVYLDGLVEENWGRVEQLARAGALKPCPDNDCGPRPTRPSAPQPLTPPHLKPYNDPRHPYRPFDPNIEQPIHSARIADYLLPLRSFASGSLVPQKPATTIMAPIGGLDRMQMWLEEALKYRDCREAMQKILAQIGSDADFAPSHTDILDLFNALRNQTGGGGIFVDVPAERLNDFLPEQARGEPVPGGSGLSNFYYTDPSNWRTRQRWSMVFVKSAFSDRPDFKRLPYNYVVTLIHEITHNAPNDLSGDGLTYKEEQMNTAAIKLGSTSFDQYVREHCIPKKYW